MQITITVPESLARHSPEELTRRVRLLLVADEIRGGRLTRVDGARSLDMALDDFLIEAGRHGLDAIDYDIADFRRELDTPWLGTTR